VKVTNASQLEAWDKKFLWHPFTQHFQWEKEPTLIVRRGRGVYIYDIQGKKYVDGVSSLWVNLVGHNHPVINRAIRKQLSLISHSTFLGLSHEPAIQLGRALAKRAPRGLVRTFYSDNGASAVEIALKMAFQYWIEMSGKMRPEFLAVKGSYHGDTIGAVSVGGIGAFHSKFKPLLFKTHFAMAPACLGCPYNKNNVTERYRLGEKISHVPKPGDKRAETGCRWECLSSVKDILKKRHKTIAGAIIEPVMQGAAGMNALPPGYVAGFARLCRSFKVLVIADEVATGFGRTGTLFACEQERVSPDILCLAKAITGGYSPLAATMTTERVFNAFWGPIAQKKTFFHGHSYTAHPLGAAAALANLELIDNIKLLEKTRRKAQIMKDELQSIARLPHVGSVRQAGLMAGVELVENKDEKKPYPTTERRGARVCKALLSRGVWLRPLGEVIVIMPPPVISDQALRRLLCSLKDVILHETKI
jgi:adenosylmethionine---8-amino-7-oxononanoate aminotransferase